MTMFYTGKNDELKTYKDKSDKRKASRMLKNHRTDPYVKSRIQPTLIKSQQEAMVQEEYKHTGEPTERDISMGFKNLTALQNNTDVPDNPSPGKKQVVFDLAPIEETPVSDAQTIIIPQRVDQLVAGDILLKIKHKGNFSSSLVCRICFNTAFAYDKEMKYTMKDLDPVSLRKNDKYDEEFAITLVNEPFCKKCTCQTPMENFCISCKTNLEKEIRSWKKIHKIIENHTATYKEVLNYESAATMHY